MERTAGSRDNIQAGRVLGLVTAGVGAFLAAGGLWLLVLSGMHSYLLGGIAYLIAGALLWRRRPEGAWLILGVLGATIGWSLWESGLDYRRLFARVAVPAGLALLATLTYPARRS